MSNSPERNEERSAMNDGAAAVLAWGRRAGGGVRSDFPLNS